MEKAANIENQLATWEEWMRTGQGHLVRQEIKSLNLKRVPREFAAKVTNYSHRIDLPAIGLRLLNPIVRPKDPRIVKKATDLELAEYAVCLLRVGAHIEATELLEKLNPELQPQSLLYRGFAHITRWEYSKAITCLRKFVANKKIDAYQKMIARVNLSAAYIFINKLSSAEELLKKLIKQTERKNMNLLNGNCHELLSQIYIRRGDFKLAQENLDLAFEKLKDSQTIGKFFVKKWKTILKIKTSKNPKEVLSSLREIRQEALKLKHWETLRDCDFYLCEVEDHPEIFQHLYFGTPQKDFRQRITTLKNYPEVLPKTYIWQAPPTLQVPSKYFILSRASDSKDEIQLKPAQLHHRLLMSLANDFYRSVGVGHLFGVLFPGEYYNPITSPERVYKSIQRFRKWAQKNGIPMDIKETEGQYRLQMGKDYGLLVEINQRNYTQEQVMVTRLKHHWPVKPFSSREAKEILNLEASSLQKLTKDLIHSHKLYAHGHGPKRLFTFSKLTYQRLESRK